MFVSHTVSEIFSIKEERDLESGVMGRSRSLKMSPFDRSCTTFYWSAIVTIALCCTIFDFFLLRIIVTLKNDTEGHSNWYFSKTWVRLTLNNIVTLKSGLEVTQGYSK